MAHIYRLIALLLLLAAGVASAAVPKVPAYRYENSGAPLVTGNDPADVCARGVAGMGANFKYSGIQQDGVNYLCKVTWTFNGGGAGNYGAAMRSGSMCPANSWESSGSCVCDTGYEEKDGVCKLKTTANSCDGLGDFCSGLKGGKINLEGKGTSSPPGCSADSARPNCPMGCAAEEVGMGVSYKTPDGSWMTGQEYRVTGGTCTLPQPSDVPQKKESDCAGSVGDVNGVRTCVPNQAATGDKKTESAKNPDGTTSNKESSTTCEKGVCTTTTVTTTKDSSGATTSTSSSTSSSSQSTYCASNKSSAVCAATNGDKNPDGKDGTDKGEGKCEGEDCEDKPGKFEGSCAGGFTCEGDGISCALAKEVHTRNCQLDALKDGPLYKAWETVKDFGNKNVTTDLPGNKRFDISITDRDDFLNPGSCPPDRVIELGWVGSLTLPFSQICLFLQIMGYINVIVTAIVGASIIIRRQS